MLIKITESCTMGCTHCMNDSKPDGRDMTLDMAQKVVDFLIEEYKRTKNYINVFVISGGEPTELKVMAFR